MYEEELSGFSLDKASQGLVKTAPQVMHMVDMLVHQTTLKAMMTMREKTMMTMAIYELFFKRRTMKPLG